MKRYDVLEYISKRESGTMPEANGLLAQIANDIKRATISSREYETKSSRGRIDVGDLNELETRITEEFAKNNHLWIPFFDVNKLGIPGPSGSESSTYVSADCNVYKINNLLHCEGSIVATLEKFILHNIIFPDTQYTFVGFTGFDGRSVYPIVKQTYIKDCKPVSKPQILSYLEALGFEACGEGQFVNADFLIKDVLPKNVLTDRYGDIYVIDVEITLR